MSNILDSGSNDSYIIVFIDKFASMDDDVKDYVLHSTTNDDDEKITKYYSSQIADYLNRPEEKFHEQFDLPPPLQTSKSQKFC